MRPYWVVVTDINLKWQIVLCWLSWKFELFSLTAHNFGSNKYCFHKFGTNMQRYMNLENKCVNFEKKIHEQQSYCSLSKGFFSHPVGFSVFNAIYLTREHQRLVANSLRSFLFIARYQASHLPLPSRSLFSCSAQVVLGGPLGLFQLGFETLPERTSSTVHRASWAGTQAACEPPAQTK